MGADYTQYGLNDQLQSKDSLAVKNDYTTSSTFDSQYEGLSAIKIADTFKVARSGTVTIPAGTALPSSQSVTVTHNLGYPPSVQAYLDTGSLIVPLPYIVFETQGADAGKIDQVVGIGEISGTTVSFFCNVSTIWIVNDAIDIRYYLMREPAK